MNAARQPETATQAKEQAQQQRQLLDMLAEIERRIAEQNARPRTRYVSPATREVSFAMYQHHMRRLIEERGTRFFPQSRGEKLYGSLTMVITLDAKGRVLETEIASASGKPLLDKRAQAIVRGASPFDVFTPEMKRQADQLVVVSRFHFARDETLETNMLAPQQSAASARSTPGQRTP